jgi:FKBP-type peptidyl-prolyl cis-trans isomerase
MIKKVSTACWNLSLLLTLLLAGCDGSSAPVAALPARNLPGAPVKGAAVKTASGLEYYVLDAGGGLAAKPGQTVTVNYTGWLLDGTKFDSSLDRHETFSFPLGAGQVVKGWDEGVVGMRVGEKRKLVVPAALGYGSTGAGGGIIPPNATLIFDVSLVSTK